jgi:hypothetical protein
MIPFCRVDKNYEEVEQQSDRKRLRRAHVRTFYTEGVTGAAAISSGFKSFSGGIQETFLTARSIAQSAKSSSSSDSSSGSGGGGGFSGGGGGGFGGGGAVPANVPRENRVGAVIEVRDVEERVLYELSINKI